jgi:hypothetical protein
MGELPLRETIAFLEIGIHLLPKRQDVGVLVGHFETPLDPL